MPMKKYPMKMKTVGIQYIISKSPKKMAPLKYIGQMNGKMPLKFQKGNNEIQLFHV